MGKKFTCNAGDTGDTGLIPRSGRSSEGGNGSPLQYSCLKILWIEGPGGPQSRVTKSWTHLSLLLNLSSQLFTKLIYIGIYLSNEYCTLHICIHSKVVYLLSSKLCVWHDETFPIWLNLTKKTILLSRNIQ